MNTTDLLSIATEICPDRDMMVFDRKRWTFSQTNERVNRLANGLMKLGIEKGGRIGVMAQLGKRYRCETCNTEILFTKACEGNPSCCDKEMQIQELRPLPSSD